MRSSFSTSSHSHSKKRLDSRVLDVIRACKTCYRLDSQACSACQEYLALNHLLSSTTTGRVNTLEATERRREILTRINESHDPLTNHFPIEITAAIFEFSLPESMGFRALDHHYHHQISDPRTTATTRYGDRHIKSGPLLLGAVCRSWRLIAWGTPQIWTTIPISLKELHSHNRGRLDILQEWFERARQLPLSIQVSCPNRLDKECKQWMPDDPFFGLINQSSDRWSELEIQGPSWVVEFFSGNSELGAPKLSTLTLCPRQGEKFEFGLSPGKKFAAPVKVSVLWGSFRWLNIDWRHTTEVTAEFALDESIELMRQAPRLTKCTISIGRNSGFFPLPPAEVPITHDNLQSLEFLFNRSNHDIRGLADGVTRFLESVSFPRLNELKFDKNIKLSWERVIDHLQRSCCELVSLEIKLRCEFHVLVALLWKTPSLRRLRITDAPLDFFKLLANTAMLPLLSSLFSDKFNHNDNGLFLPNLEYLNVWPYLDSITDRFWDGALNIFGPLTKVRNRHFYHRPLKKLEINRFWRPDEGILAIGIDRKVGERISELQEAGIVIEVKDWNNKYDLLKLATAHHKIPLEF